MRTRNISSISSRYLRLLKKLPVRIFDDAFLIAFAGKIKTRPSGYSFFFLFIFHTRVCLYLLVDAWIKLTYNSTFLFHLRIVIRMTRDTNTNLIGAANKKVGRYDAGAGGGEKIYERYIGGGWKNVCVRVNTGKRNLRLNNAACWKQWRPETNVSPLTNG